MTWLADLLQRPPVTFWDMVDILIVSLIVYEVLKLIRGTHAVQMALGIAVLVGMFYFSRGFQLETLNWLIRNVVGYVVFAAIVLFQADIRRELINACQLLITPVRLSPFVLAQHLMQTRNLLIGQIFRRHPSGGRLVALHHSPPPP